MLVWMHEGQQLHTYSCPVPILSDDNAHPDRVPVRHLSLHTLRHLGNSDWVEFGSLKPERLEIHDCRRRYPPIQIKHTQSSYPESKPWEHFEKHRPSGSYRLHATPRVHGRGYGSHPEHPNIHWNTECSFFRFVNPIQIVGKSRPEGASHMHDKQTWK